MYAYGAQPTFLSFFVFRAMCNLVQPGWVKSFDLTPSVEDCWGGRSTTAFELMRRLLALILIVSVIESPVFWSFDFEDKRNGRMT